MLCFQLLCTVKLCCVFDISGPRAKSQCAQCKFTSHLGTTLTHRQGQTDSLTSQQCQQQLQVQRHSLWSTLDAIGAKKQPHANSQEGCTDEEHDQRCPGHFIPSPVTACNSDPFCLYLAWVNIDISIAHPNLVVTLLSILEDGWSDAKLVCGAQGHILHHIWARCMAASCVHMPYVKHTCLRAQ